MSLDAFL